jgi:hypothetical protein
MLNPDGGPFFGPNFYQDWDGRGGKIRTCDLTVPNRALYQAEPRPVILTFHEGNITKERILLGKTHLVKSDMRKIQ